MLQQLKEDKSETAKYTIRYKTSDGAKYRNFDAFMDFMMFVLENKKLLDGKLLEAKCTDDSTNQWTMQVKFDNSIEEQKYRNLFQYVRDVIYFTGRIVRLKEVDF